MHLQSLLCMLWISSLVGSAPINAPLPGDGGQGERQTFSTSRLSWFAGVREVEVKEEIGACMPPPLESWLYPEAGLRPPVRGY